MYRYGTHVAHGYGTDMAPSWHTDMAPYWHTDMAQRHIPIFRTKLKLVSVLRCPELRDCRQPAVSHLISYACRKINGDYSKIVIY